MLNILKIINIIK